MKEEALSHVPSCLHHLTVHCALYLLKLQLPDPVTNLARHNIRQRFWMQDSSKVSNSRSAPLSFHLMTSTKVLTVGRRLSTMTSSLRYWKGSESHSFSVSVRPLARAASAQNTVPATAPRPWTKGVFLGAESHSDAPLQKFKAPPTAHMKPKGRYWLGAESHSAAPM